MTTFPTPSRTPLEGSGLLTSHVATVQDNSAHGEDRYLVRVLGDNAVLDAVMDGVTGRSGAQASQWVVDALAAAPLTSAADLMAVLQEVNHQLYEIGRGRFLLTTVSTALYLDGRLSVIGIGDSPVYLMRSDSCQHLFNPVRGVLMGASAQLIDPYRTAVMIEPGDRVVLATDGLTDNVASSELREIVRSTASPEKAAEQISVLVASRQAQGLSPPPLRANFRGDDWTAIFRFFSSVR